MAVTFTAGCGYRLTVASIVSLRAWPAYAELARLAGGGWAADRGRRSGSHRPDARSGRHLGNFPQAFTHLALINAVMHVIRQEHAAQRLAIGRDVPDGQA
jgi:hypothetical protein